MHRKYAVTALLVAAVTDFSAGAVNAAPLPAPVVHEQPAAAVTNPMRGMDQGIGYTVQPIEAGSALVAGVTGGRFALDRGAVVLRNNAGKVVTAIPLTVTSGGRQVGLAAAIAADGRQLTLRPTNPALRRHNFRTSLDWWNYELGKAAPSAGIGAIIGAVIGVFFLGIGIIPGAAIGAVIGLLVGGGQDLIDSGYAYFGGQP